MRNLACRGRLKPKLTLNLELRLETKRGQLSRGRSHQEHKEEFRHHVSTRIRGVEGIRGEEGQKYVMLGAGTRARGQGSAYRPV